MREYDENGYPFHLFCADCICCGFADLDDPRYLTDKIGKDCCDPYEEEDDEP